MNTHQYRLSPRIIGFARRRAPEWIRILLSRQTPAYKKILWFKTRGRARYYRLLMHLPQSASSLRELRYRELWCRGILDEVEWFETWLVSEEGNSFIQEVMNSRRVLQDHLVHERVHDLASKTVSILEIGTGPVFSLGYTLPGKVLRIKPTDPLAVDYRRMLKHLDITPIMPVEKCDAARLTGKFGKNTFDVVYASNSIDHSYDPVLVIEQMFDVAKKGGYVILRHYRNEGSGGEGRGTPSMEFRYRERRSRSLE